jgi:hypothetical protein
VDDDAQIRSDGAMVDEVPGNDGEEVEPASAESAPASQLRSLLRQAKQPTGYNGSLSMPFSK